jgi:hypothetical protein
MRSYRDRVRVTTDAPSRCPVLVAFCATGPALSESKGDFLHCGMATKSHGHSD